MVCALMEASVFNTGLEIILHRKQPESSYLGVSGAHHSGWKLEDYRLIHHIPQLPFLRNMVCGMISAAIQFGI